jgi:hypothetical protein
MSGETKDITGDGGTKGIEGYGEIISPSPRD